MKLRIQLRAAPGGQPGHGELVLRGWEHAPDALTVSVQRNRDSYYLDADGGWGSAPVDHALGEVRKDGDALVAAVGPWLVDPLLGGTGMTYLLTLRNARGEGSSVPQFGAGLLPSAAAGQSHSTASTAVHSAAPPAPTGELAADVASEAPPEPAPVLDAPAPTPAPGKKSPWWRWLLPGLLLALIGAALWWFVLRPGSGSGAVADAGDAGDTSPCGSGSMAQTSDDLLFIRSCLATQPSSQDVLEVIAAAKAARRCNLVRRLYAYKAQAGDVEVALAYAREYDPRSFSGGCIEAADADTAIYWYEIVTEHDPDNHEAQQRLQELNQ